MNQAEIAKLVTCIEENLRASPTSGLPFVDSRHSRTRLLSKQNHVVFGRRGAGKTTLVSSLQESGSHIEIYLNVPLGEWEKIPRLQATTLVGLRYYEKLSQNLSFGL